MIRRPPISTRTDTLFPYTTLFRSMAFDAEGHILGVRVNTHANVGAYLLDFGPRISTVAGARVAGTVYQVPAMQLAVRVMFTNPVPTDAYRGAGRPEMAYQMEQLLDMGAAAFGIDRAEIRRRNFIRPDQPPRQIGNAPRRERGC